MKRARRSGAGRPALFAGGRARSFNLTDKAWEKAEADAEILSRAAGFRVSISQAIDAAVRQFNAKRFKP
jgi:hypothetical protein